MNLRAPRLHDSGFLLYLKLRPCVVCGKPPPSDPAHLKSGNLTLGKPSSGSAKPDDKWCNSLCRKCHDEQHHAGNELAWWHSKGIDPFMLAIRTYREYGGTGGTSRAPRKIKPRKPRELRTKIQSRGFAQKDRK